MRSDRLDRRPHGRPLMALQVVHDDDVAGREVGHEDLVDVGLEGVAVDRAVEHEGSDHPGQAQARDKGRGFPMAVRHG